MSMRLLPLLSLSLLFSISSQTPKKGILDEVLKIFDLDYDDLVVEEGENWVEKYYIKQIKKCEMKMPDGFTADMKSLARNAPPDYSYMDA